MSVRASLTTLSAIAVGLTTVAVATPARANTYNVTNLLDSGGGSLRDAITQANANPGADTIQFNVGVIPSPPAFVNLQTALPAVTGDVTIIGPGSSQVVVQPDPFSGPPQITLINITGTPTVEIRGLSFTGGHGVNGGAIAAQGGSLTIRECSLFLNNADNSGGGVSMMGAGNATLNVIDSSLFTNNAINIGGGVAVTRFSGSAIVNVTGSTLSRNTTTGTGVGHFGGGLYVAGGFNPHTVTISTSTINDNSLAFDGKGGGVYVDAAGGSLSMTNSTLSGNVAEMGGGLGYQSSSLTLLACTITSNNSTAPNDGALHDANMVGMSIKNTILSGNISGGALRDLTDTQLATGNNNLVGVGGPFVNGVNGNIVGVTDPRLTPLNTNGGLTMTFSLKPDSPALDKGSNPDSPATDQRGQPRIADGDNDGTATADIGAFETQRYLVINTMNAGVGSLRQAISDNNLAGGGFIKFAIPALGQQKTILPKSPLPTIVRICYIDGWSQGGNAYQGPPLIEIDGNQIQNAIGLDIQWSDCILRGLAVNNFLGTSNAVGYKISSRSGLRNWIYGCYAGVGLNGLTNRGNAQIGIWIAPTANSNIIGTNADNIIDDMERNVVAGSNRAGLQTGIYIESNSNIISGNYVGTDASGMVAIPNFNGIWVVSGTSNQIGSSPTSLNANASRNIVSGNTNVGIEFSSQGSNNFVSGNYVGVKADGSTALSNAVGVMLDDSNRTLIGGTSVGERNVIAGNTAQGIIISGSFAFSNLVQGNYIGLNPAGISAIPNQMGGVLVRLGATFTRIGAFGDNSSLEISRRNIISGNGVAGVTLQDPASNDNRVMGCYIGLDASGASSVPNTGVGVMVSNSPSNLIGGLGSARNAICAQSGASGDGVGISGGSSVGNKVRNNLIGVKPAGGAAGNSQAGVRIFGGAQANAVGGVNPGEGNTILNNGHGGVLVLDDDSVANSILGNSIFANSGLGIDLKDDGVTPNGLANQFRVGPNSLQNYPVLDAVSAGGSISGTLTAIGLTKYRVEFFSTPVADPSNFGEGRTFLGFAEVTTNSGGIAPVGLNMALPVGESLITATATELAPEGAVRGFPTDPGMPLGTSEFAMIRAANSAPTTVDQVANTLEDTDVTITLLATDPDAGTVFAFRITNLPALGQLFQVDAITPITAAGTVVTDAGGRVVFRPAPNQFGSPYTTFTFIANDGVLDSNESTVTVNVTPVNDPPAGLDKTVTIAEDATYTFAASDFGFSDPIDIPANTLFAVKITTLPAAGQLKLGAANVTLGQSIPVASIPILTFTPASNAIGAPYTSFTFQVQDNGGIANGGIDLDPTPNLFTFNVTGINDPPAGADKLVTMVEDSTYIFAATDFGFTDPNDTPPNTFFAVKITTLPTAGSLTLSGVPVTLGQFVPVAGIPNLLFTPAANAIGSPYGSFTFQVQDNGGTAGGGVDLDQTPNLFTFNVTGINDPPAGTDKVVTIAEDATYTFGAADFGFSDPNDTPPNAFFAVKITTLPAAGSLTLSGVPVTIGQFVPVAGLPTLVFTPAANAIGSPYASFTFQVQDNGGTVGGGLDLDQSPNTFTIIVTGINDPPAGADKLVTIAEDTTYPFAITDFGFTDPNDTPPNAFLAVKITTLPTAGSLTLSSVPVTLGQFVPVASIPSLLFTPAANAVGSPYASFTFQVQDDGGTAGGGLDLDQSPNTFTFNVTGINDPPAGMDKTVTIAEDTTYAFAATDFGFTDPNDTPPNTFFAVKITTLPTAGALTLSGVPVTLGQFVPVAGIPSLLFTPAANAVGSPYASFTFQVQDNGGTAGGGLDLDQSPNTFTINVTGINDPPAGADKLVTIAEDATYTFAITDFGFTDPNDTPPNAFLAVKITTLPLAGTLKLGAANVTAGQFIPVAGIPTLTFAPAPNAIGSPYASFTFQVQDNGGTANGGLDLDQSPNIFTFNVTGVNDAPAGADKLVTIFEDANFTFAATDFGFTDPNDTPPDSFVAVKVTTLPLAGSLTLSGVPVALGQFIPVANIPTLVFTPAANATGTPYASFTFQVQDSGGTAGGGVDLDQSPNTFTINVSPINDPPAGADNSITILEDSTHAFAAAEFGFTDPNDTPPDTFLAVRITTLPTAGTLRLGAVNVTVGQSIPVANIPTLNFAPAANASGTPYASFIFQVQDSGGTAGGGLDLDQSPNTFTINVTPVNDPPAGADKTVAIVEDATYAFATTDFGFTDPSDTPPNTFLALKITTLPTAGSLTLSSVPVTLGQFVPVASIPSLLFTPAANASGTPYASFTFQVQDNGGTANGGVDLDQTPNVFTINVTDMNDAPAGTDKIVTIVEDATYTFAVGDFGFTDPNDTPPNTFLAVEITTLPAAGTLTLGAANVVAGQFIPVASIPTLVFTPASNTSGTPYASFTFQVQDNGGTAGGGADLDPTPNTFTINVTTINDPPAGADNTITVLEDSSHAFAAAEFGFSDPNDTPPNTFLAVKITTLPAAGSLKLGAVNVIAGQFIPVASIPTLTFTPAANANGAAYASFTFQVQDNGGTADGGLDLDQSPNTITIDVTPLNDPPAGADRTVVTLEDAGYTFGATDFGFTDPNDTPANAFFAVKITTLPIAGALTVGGGPVIAGQVIPVGAIPTLVFTPAPDANGLVYASFTFQVQDDGGTAGGGVDLDPTPNTISINVTPVNDPPTFVAANPPAELEGSGSHVINPIIVSFNPGPANESSQTLTEVIVDQISNPALFSVLPHYINGRLDYTFASTGFGSSTVRIQVRDSGGTANGGIDLSAPQVITIIARPAAVCRDVTLDARAACIPLTVTPAQLNGTPADPSPGATQTITFSRSLALPFAFGTTSVIVTANYSDGLVSSCTAHVTVLADDCNHDGIPDSCQGGGGAGGVDCNGDGLSDACQCVWDNGAVSPLDALTANGQLSHLGSNSTASKVADDFYLCPNHIYRIFNFSGQVLTNALIRKAQVEFYEDCNGRPADAPFKTFTNSTVLMETPAGNGYSLITYSFDLCSECFYLDGGKSYWVALVGRSDQTGNDLTYWVATTPTSSPSTMIGVPPVKRSGTGGPEPYPFTFQPWESANECCLGCVNMSWHMTGEACLDAWNNGTIDLNPATEGGTPSGTHRATPIPPRAAENFVIKGCDPVKVCYIETYIWTNCNPVQGFAEFYDNECFQALVNVETPPNALRPIAPSLLPFATILPTRIEPIPNTSFIYNGVTLNAYKLIFCQPNLMLQGGRTYWISSGSYTSGSVNGEALFAYAAPPCNGLCPIRLTPGGSLDRNVSPQVWLDTGHEHAFRISVRGELGLFNALPATPPPPTCRADINNDGVVNPQDVFDFLNAWFTGCP